MSNSKKNRNNGTKRRKKQLSPEAKRRQRAAQAKIGSFLGVAVLLVGVVVLFKMGSSVEVPLEIQSEGYVCLAPEEESESQTVIDENGEAVEVQKITEAPLPEDPLAENIRKINITLPETYPIDMIIRSEYAIVYDSTANKVLYAKNPDEKCYPASTTKILTSAVTIKNATDGMVFRVGDEQSMVNAGSSLAMVNIGSELDLQMIVDGMMLPSGNDASYCAAANIGRILGEDDSLSADGAVKLFMEEMNKTLKNIGCENTHFSVPDGFHDDDHYTTVKDMLRVTLYAQQFPMLLDSAATPYKYVTFLSGEAVSWENSNKLIHDYSDCYYMYANGMKTGMTDEAGYCVVATARRFDHDVICIVFGSSASDIRWNDTIALLDAAFVQIRAS
ncbi:MAG: D-alanyl-D-alanine carboxypeptidase family protein [Oscillospiraceae bacterium]